MRRGVLCIGTGTYSPFIPILEENIAATDAADVVFALTDDQALLARPVVQDGRLQRVRLPWGRLPWPLPTLLRYHAIRSYGPLLRSEVTHLVYCDVDMRVVGPVDELFRHPIFAVQHPGGTQEDAPSEPPYEQDRRSRAFVPNGAPGPYVAGGLQGGEVATYLSAVDDLAEAVTVDHLAGITARWHDESHWNRYVHDAGGSVHVLGARYCWPESWPVPEGVGEPRVLALDKDHHGLRGTRPPRGLLWKDRVVKVPLARSTVRTARRFLRASGR